MGIRLRVGRAAAVAALVTASVAGMAPAAQATSAAPVWPRQVCQVNAGQVHFRTPEAAMRYLAKAWNCNDVAALRHVTTPGSRAELLEMKHEAVNMTLDRCTREGSGDYQTYYCEFTHHYPKGVAHDDPGPDGLGRAYIFVFPARAPGWYAHEHIGCG
jgi:hypothetical protein